MFLKKSFALITALLIAITALPVQAEAAETSFSIEVDDDTREVVISGESAQPVNTMVSLSVWYPDKSPANLLAEGGSGAGINAYTDQSRLDSDSEYSFSFKMKPDNDEKDGDPSGRYTVNVYVQGEMSVQSFSYDYINVEKSKLVLEKVRTGVKETIANTFNTSLIDANVAAAIEAKSYSDKQKEYLVDSVLLNAPRKAFSQLTSEEQAETTEEVWEKEARKDLKDTLAYAVKKLSLVKEISNSKREAVKSIIQNHYTDFGVTDVDYATYRGFGTDIEEKFITLLTADVKDDVLPADVVKSFKKALGDAQSPTVIVDKNDGYGGGGGSVSVSKELTDGNVVPVEPASSVFSDLGQAEWARIPVTVLSERGIINGKGNGKFCPNDYITREELIKLVIKGFNLKAASERALTFTDVQKDAWYYDSVKTAFELNIVNGFSKTEFGVGVNISRQDLTVILCNALKYVGVTLPEMQETETLSAFNDRNAVADYAKQSVYALSQLNVIQGKGDGGFAPVAPATRAETAKMLYEVLYRFNLL